MPIMFNYVKKGYNPAEVDTYIKNLEDVIASYKEKDAAIKNAIVSAQIAADNIVKNAELEAEELRRGVIKKFTLISDSIVRQKSIVTEFKEEYNALVKKYLTDFNDQEIASLLDKIDELDSYINSLNN